MADDPTPPRPSAPDLEALQWAREAIADVPEIQWSNPALAARAIAALDAILADRSGETGGAP